MSLLASAEPLKATARGRYLYAIVDDASDGRTFDCLGLDGSTVYAIGDGAVAAIVSDLPNQKIRPERRRLAAHNAGPRGLDGRPHSLADRLRRRGRWPRGRSPYSQDQPRGLRRAT